MNQLSVPIPSIGAAKKAGLSPNRSGALVLFLSLVWISSVLAANAFQMERTNRAGIVGVAPSDWPRESCVARRPARPILVMAAHPRCPCTRASLDQLELVMRQARGRVDAVVLFIQPEGTDEAWARTASFERTQLIPGVTAQFDPAASECRKFGCSTSGHVLFFDGHGTLKFSGGLTSARATEGPSAGFLAVLSLVNTGSTPLPKAPVYGCPLEEGTKEKP